MVTQSSFIEKYHTRVALYCSGNGCGEWAASKRGVRVENNLFHFPTFFRIS
jgi:hypothetical protein